MLQAPKKGGNNLTFRVPLRYGRTDMMDVWRVTQRSGTNGEILASEVAAAAETRAWDGDGWPCSVVEGWLVLLNLMGFVNANHRWTWCKWIRYRLCKKSTCIYLLWYHWYCVWRIWCQTAGCFLQLEVQHTVHKQGRKGRESAVAYRQALAKILYIYIYKYISHQVSMPTAIFITVSLFWHINICKHVTTITFAKKGRGIKSHFKFWAQSVFGIHGFFRARMAICLQGKSILVGMNVELWPRPLSSIYPSFKHRNWNVTPKIGQWHVPVFELFHWLPWLLGVRLNHAKCISTFPATWTIQSL